jgi:integrase
VAKRLTATAVENYRPRKRRREIPDGGCPGLFLIVQPSGVKSWALRFRRPGSGRAAKLTLGRVDITGAAADAPPAVGRPLSLAAARRLAAELQHQRALGKDVAAEAIAEKRRRRAAVEDAAANTFPAAARDYIVHCQRMKQRHWRDSATMLGLGDDLKPFPRGLADRWRDKPITEIDKYLIDGVVNEARHHGVPGRPRRSNGPTEGMARAVYTVLSSMFNWLKLKGRVDANPVASVAKPYKAEARDRALDDAEIIALWHATEEMGQPFGAIFRLLLLTGARLGEIAAVTWDEVKDDGATLSLPRERTKNKRPHDIFLAPAAREIIAATPRIADCPFIFTTNGKTAASGFSKAKTRLDRLMGPVVEPWRTHDLRRTVASGLQRLDVKLEVTERVLGHVGGSFAGIVGVYQRHEYAAERREALERWAAHVAGLVAGRPTNVVVSIGGRRR